MTELRPRPRPDRSSTAPILPRRDPVTDPQRNPCDRRGLDTRRDAICRRCVCSLRLRRPGADVG